MAFDIIGNIAILHPSYGDHRKNSKNLMKNLKIMKNLAVRLLKENKNIRAVYAEEKIYGRLRIPKLKWLAGLKKTETLYKENGCIMKLDIKTCYFSPRLSHDRLEIAKKVRPKEKVLVMFSGVAPYAIVISKHSKAKEIYCIEISRKASKYAKENVKLNKINNIKIIQGDVKRIIPKLKALRIKFDRIVMARPQLKEIFLKEAFDVSKIGTTIHFYDFINKREINNVREKIKNAAKKSRKNIRILRIKKVREIAPYKYHLRVDFKIKK